MNSMLQIMHLFFFQLLTYLLILPLWGHSLEDKLQEAHTYYQQGEKATDYQERKQAFNKALFLYQTLEQENPHSPDLDQVLGDTYFQLGEYSWAILYYERALKKGSHNALLLPHLTQAKEKLGLPASINDTNENGFFYSLSQQTNLLLGALLITFFISSCAIWFPFYWLQKLAMICTLFLTLLMGHALFFYYSTPSEGILIKSTGFYRFPDWNQPQLKSQPLLAGSKVKILQINADENWLKIEETGMIGYVPTDHIRPI